MMNLSFSTLGLSPEILRAVAEKGYQDATPVQQQVIPSILQGKDLIAGAQTGTGKTAGFTLPMLQRLQQAPKAPGQRAIRTLILAPSRELAAQVGVSVEAYGKYLPLRSTVVYGGVKIVPQMRKLRSGVDILVATPGRLLDLYRQGVLDLSNVEIFVLDEADRMLDMGFIHDIREIISLLPKKRQNLMFSATTSPEIRKLADSILVTPEKVQIAQQNAVSEYITQFIHPVSQKQKRELLSFMIGSQNLKQVLVFTRTKHSADRLTTQLIQDGIEATAIHSNKNQGARTRALEAFKRGKIQVLVATDIASRGIDISQLSDVINFELPFVPEDYLHRIGRTGRAGNPGRAISLVSPDEIKLLKSIERLLKLTIPRVPVDGYDAGAAESDYQVSLADTVRKGRGANRPQRSYGGREGRGGKRGSYRSRDRENTRGEKRDYQDVPRRKREGDSGRASAFGADRRQREGSSGRPAAFGADRRHREKSDDSRGPTSRGRDYRSRDGESRSAFAGERRRRDDSPRSAYRGESRGESRSRNSDNQSFAGSRGRRGEDNAHGASRGEKFSYRGGDSRGAVGGSDRRRRGDSDHYSGGFAGTSDRRQTKRSSSEDYAGAGDKRRTYSRDNTKDGSARRGAERPRKGSSSSRPAADSITKKRKTLSRSKT